MQNALKISSFILLLILPCFGTTITGTIRDSSGQLFNGTVTFQLNASAIDYISHETVPSIPFTFNIINGILYQPSSGSTVITLKGCDTLLPANSQYYTLYRTSDGTPTNVYLYYVSGTTYDLGSAIPTPITTSNISYTTLLGLSALSVINNGTFLTAQNDYLFSNINSYNIATEYSGVSGGNHALDAITGVANIPSGSTTWQVNGVFGGVVNASTVTQAVGIYGLSRSAAPGAAALAANFVSTGTAGVGNGNITDVEFDFNPLNATDTGSAVATVYGTVMQSNAANANLCSTAHPGVAQWSACWVASIGATTGGSASPAISLQPTASGLNHPSQSINLVSSDPSAGTHSGTIAETAAGVLGVTNSNFSAPKFNATGTGNGTFADYTAVASGQVAYAWKDTSQAADAKEWDFVVGLDANTFRGRAINDAEGSATTWLKITRSGISITDINLNGPISTANQFSSTLGTGTAPFSVASTTNVANLNASSLNGATFAAPGAIGGGTPSSGAFTSVSSAATTNNTGLQLLNSSTTCTTGAAVGATCTTAAITLPVAYSDTNYRASCTGQGATNVPIVQTITKSNTTFTITIAALTAAAATFTSYDCIVGHN